MPAPVDLCRSPVTAASSSRGAARGHPRLTRGQGRGCSHAGLRPRCRLPVPRPWKRKLMRSATQRSADCPACVPAGRSGCGGAERSGGRHLPRAGVRWQRQDCQCQAAGVLVTSLLRLRTGEQMSGKSLATAKGEVWHYTKVSTNWAIPTLSGTRPKWSPTPFVYTRPSSC